MPARLIALEGIDQSGKRTQTRLLAQHLRNKGFNVQTLSFPIYKSHSGREIQAFLDGKHVYPLPATHMLYSLNRWENLQLIKKLIEDSDFLIADRYTSSNLAYGVSRGLDLGWLRNLDRGLPEADLVLVLDVPVPASFARKSRNRDVHESNRRLLLKVRRTYKSLARRLGWRVVDGTGAARKVHDTVWSQVQKTFDKHRRS